LPWLDRYRADGYALLPGIVGTAEVDGWRDYLRQLTASPGRSNPDGAIVSAPIQDQSFLSGIASDRRLEDTATQILGDAPVVFGATFIVKPALRGLPVLWHQDGYPWRTQMGITDAVTLWLALDPIEARNGGLAVIPGSHLLPLSPLIPSREAPNMFGVEVDPSMVREDRARALGLDPGDVCVHHPALLHRSAPNLSGSPRRALAIRYRAAQQ
jgi:phytanoyl-CoA hydroxylase